MLWTEMPFTAKIASLCFLLNELVVFGVQCVFRFCFVHVKTDLPQFIPGLLMCHLRSGRRTKKRGSVLLLLSGWFYVQLRRPLCVQASIKAVSSCFIFWRACFFEIFCFRWCQNCQCSNPCYCWTTGCSVSLHLRRGFLQVLHPLMSIWFLFPYLYVLSSCYHVVQRFWAQNFNELVGRGTLMALEAMKLMLLCRARLFRSRDHLKWSSCGVRQNELFVCDWVNWCCQTTRWFFRP